MMSNVSTQLDSTATQIDDLQLLRRYSKNGDAEAFQLLVVRYQNLVWSVCLRVLGNTTDAEDAAQNVFLALAKNASRIESNLASWLHSTAVNRSTSLIRSDSARRVREYQHPVDIITSDDEHAWGEMRELVDVCLQELEDQDREIVIQRFYNGMTQAELGEYFGISQQYAHVRVKKAISRLRKSLEKRGVTLSTATLSGGLSLGLAEASIPAQVSILLSKIGIVGVGVSKLGSALSATAVAKGFVAVAFCLAVAAWAVRSAPATSNPAVQSSVLPANIDSNQLVLGEQAFRHRTNVWQVEFLPDGNRIATVSRTGKTGVYLWDVATGKKIREFVTDDEEQGWPHSLAVSPDGRLIAVGRSLGKISVWNIESGELLCHQRRGESLVSAVAFSPDSSKLLRANTDGVILLFDVHDFSSELTRLVVPMAEGEKIKESQNYSPLNSRAQAVAFSPDGSLLAVANSNAGNIFVFDTSTNEVVQKMAEPHIIGSNRTYPHRIRSICFTLDGSQLLVGGYRGIRRNTTTIQYGAKGLRVLEVRLWEVESGELIRKLVDIDHPEQPDISGDGFVKLAPDGESFVTLGDDAIRFWDFNHREPQYTIPIPDIRSSIDVDYSPDGMLLAIPLEKGIVLRNTKTKELHYGDRLPLYNGMHGVAWSGKNKIAIAAREVQIFDALTGQLEYRLSLGPEPKKDFPWPFATRVEFSADASVLMASGGRYNEEFEARGGAIRAWDTQTGQQLIDISVDRRIWEMAIAPDASVAAVATCWGNQSDAQLLIYDLATGELISKLPDNFRNEKGQPRNGLAIPLAVKIPPASDVVCFFSRNGQCIRWNFRLHKQEKSFFADRRSDVQAATKVIGGLFAPDGKTLITSSEDKVGFWDIETESLLHMEDIALMKRALQLGISADGRRLAGVERMYSTYDGSDKVHIWDVATHKKLISVEPENKRARQFAFSPDNTKLLMAFDRGLAEVWNVDTDLRNIETN